MGWAVLGTSKQAAEAGTSPVDAEMSLGPSPSAVVRRTVSLEVSVDESLRSRVRGADLVGCHRSVGALRDIGTSTGGSAREASDSSSSEALRLGGSSEDERGGDDSE